MSKSIMTPLSNCTSPQQCQLFLDYGESGCKKCVFSLAVKVAKKSIFGMFLRMGETC